MADAETCVCCGEIIPEGRQVCMAHILPLVTSVSEYEALKIIAGRGPRGRFYTIAKNGKYVGIDNATGEEFDTKGECLRWLKG